MKLLVTGGAGYVGSVCAATLVEAGHDVTIIDNFSTGNREAVPAEATLVEGDVADVVTEVLSQGGFDGVVHFAARSLVGESVEMPAEYWQHNVVTTLTLLEAMRANEVNNLVFSSTAATYGEPEQVPITEDMPTQPTNPYGASKLAIDYMITSYAKAYGLGATSLRYFNVAGAYDQIGENREVETHLIPIVLQVHWATATRFSCSVMTGAPSMARRCATTSTFAIWLMPTCWRWKRTLPVSTESSTWAPVMVTRSSRLLKPAGKLPDILSLQRWLRAVRATQQR